MSIEYYQLYSKRPTQRVNHALMRHPQKSFLISYQIMSWKKESYSIHPKMWLMYYQKSVGYKLIEAFSFLF